WIADKYSDFFSGTEIEFIKEPLGAKSNYWLNSILLKDKKERNAFLEYSHDHGVMTRPAWELMNRLSMFSKAQRGDLSNSEWISDRLVNLPSSVILPK